ncbi:small integral membrane 7 [Brachionus plicatilis]|uniref:Small integral membrane 7 n=1 Tax=Brachionus plicatilis TaxID=10195 RepID=A0A3M7P9L3_BRAPC|nr:small integral membrane 7 [Brachionus plicatilis]
MIKNNNKAKKIIAVFLFTVYDQHIIGSFLKILSNNYLQKLDLTTDKIKEFIENIQYFRIFIALWNFFIIFLMFSFFGN